MPATERITISLPSELVECIDRFERNRSRFIAEAVQHELQRRRREELLHSLRSPHPESRVLAEAGMADWAANLPAEDAEGLVEPSAGQPVRWTENHGWVVEPHES